MKPAPPKGGSLIHFTPLRYPGGKGKLAAYVRSLFEENSLLDGEYAEPYAGGAAIALELLLHEYASRIHINDISRPVYSFWKSVLDHTDDLVKLVHNTKLTVSAWDKQKAVLRHADDHDDLALGFATFFLNRTNRSGILNGGIIGGRDQTGPWKIDARYNAPELIFRIESIARLKCRISLTCVDAKDFIVNVAKLLPARSLVYLDPPYYVQGKQLYYDYYQHADHEVIAALVGSTLQEQRWIVSYDNAPEIRKLYQRWRRMTYSIGYSARDVREGREVMFFCDYLKIPPLAGSMHKGRIDNAHARRRSAG
jgi:DNA adenine methylase